MTEDGKHSKIFDSLPPYYQREIFLGHELIAGLRNRQPVTL